MPCLILVTQLALAICWVARRAGVADGVALPGYDTGAIGGGTLAGGDLLEGVAADQLAYVSVAHFVIRGRISLRGIREGQGRGDDGIGVV